MTVYPTPNRTRIGDIHTCVVKRTFRLMAWNNGQFPTFYGDMSVRRRTVGGSKPRHLRAVCADLQEERQALPSTTGLRRKRMLGDVRLAQGLDQEAGLLQGRKVLGNRAM